MRAEDGIYQWRKANKYSNVFQVFARLGDGDPFMLRDFINEIEANIPYCVFFLAYDGIIL